MPLNNDDIKQLINILQKGLVEDNNSETRDTPSPTSNSVEKTKKSNKGIKSKTSNVKKKMADSADSSYNRFDTMPEKNMHKDDTRIDKILNQYSPTQRTREFHTIDVICRICGKKESINAALSHDSGSRYKCNRCARTPG